MKPSGCLQISGTDDENAGRIAIRTAEMLCFGTNDYPPVTPREGVSKVDMVAEL